jgi:hypothetical protein
MNERNNDNKHQMKAQNLVPTINTRKPWGFMQAIAATVAGVFNRELGRNKLPGNVKVTASPDNDRVQLVPIFRGKVESKRAVQACRVLSMRMKGKGFGL